MNCSPAVLGAVSVVDEAGAVALLVPLCFAGLVVAVGLIFVVFFVAVIGLIGFNCL